MTDQDLEQLRRLFEVMERLRAPGGCPWDRAQSHRTLVPFLLEESYETIQAIEEGSSEELAEELGDLLVEVAMHCAISAEEGSFDIGGVARTAAQKMIGRHPHVFSDTQVSGVEQVLSNWEDLKGKEKPERESALDGIPRSLPALALASSLQRRQERVGGEILAVAALTEAERLIQSRLHQLGQAEGSAEGLIGELLFAVVALARHHQVDAEGALRRTAEARRQVFRRAELEAAREAPHPRDQADHEATQPS